MGDTAPTEKIQVVDGQGQFLAPQVEQFAHDSKLAESKGDYQVVAIMGPQSSGKSTLLNNVFGTSFVMMDALSGRSQTTKGIWLSKSEKVSDHLTLVMDLEGNDGRERGEDDANFERQIALFALAVADVLLINIWCHDIGRETAAGKPLLRTIFQVNLKLFAPEPNRKRTVLLFVIRDKSKTPMAMLSQTLADDLNQMWNSIAKPAAYQDSKISDFFEVQYAGMSHFEERHDDFLVDAAVLRRRFSPDGDDSLVRPHDHLPGTAFAFSVGSIWDTIRQQKDLNLPAHKIMVANIRCAEIARDQLAAFASDQAWEVLQQEATGGGLEQCVVLPGFNTRLTGLMDSCIQGYEEDALYFDASVRAEKLAELQAKLAQAVSGVVQAQTAALHTQQLGVLRKELLVGLMGGPDGKAPPGGLPFTTTAAAARTAAIAAFKKAFNENLRLDIKGWDGKEALAAFETAADQLVSDLRNERIREATNTALKQLGTSLSGPVISLLDACPEGVWPKLHSLTASASVNTTKTLLQGLSGFALSADEQTQLVQQIRDAARTRLEGHAREAAQTRLSRMKDRFTDMFTQDANKSPRMWRPHENIPAIAREARLAAAQLLAQLVAIRPAPAPGATQTQLSPAASGELQTWVPDAIEKAIMKLARQDVDPTGNRSDDSFSGVVDLMSVATWPDVDEGLVLVAPHEARTTWRDFMTASNGMILQANATQEANRMAGNRMPPIWAIAAMLVLGWNEAVALVWNPVYLIITVLLMLFGYSLYQELDVESEMSRGSLPGVLSIATKIGPAVRNILTRTREALQGFVENPGERLEHITQMVREMELPGMESPAPPGGSANKYVVADGANGAAKSAGAHGAGAHGSSVGAHGAGAAGISGVSVGGLSKRPAAGAATTQD